MCIDGIIIDVHISFGSVNHVEPVIVPINAAGALPIFLPPYSPDLIPIEECFSNLGAI